MLWVDTLLALEDDCRDMEDSAEVSAINSTVQGILQSEILFFFFFKPQLPNLLKSSTQQLYQTIFLSVMHFVGIKGLRCPLQNLT